MAEKIVSPGVFTNEIDQSFIPAALAELGAVVVGPTVKGPILEPTVVSSYGEYVQTFGELIESGSDKYQYLTSHTAREYLRQGGPLTVVRVGTPNSTRATATISKAGDLVVGNKAVGSLTIAGDFGQNVNDETQITVDGTEFRFVASDPDNIPEDTSNVFFHVTGSNTATYLDNLVAEINNANIGVVAVDGTTELNLTASSAGTGGNSISVDTGSGANMSDQLTLSGGTANSSAGGDLLTLEVLGDGTQFNNTSSLGTDSLLNPRVNNAASNNHFGSGSFGGRADNIRYEISNRNLEKGTFTLLIRQGNDTTKRKVILETHANLSLDPESTDYVLKRIGNQTNEVATEDGVAYLKPIGEYPNMSKYVRVSDLPDSNKTPNYLDDNGNVTSNYSDSSSFFPSIGSGSYGGSFDGGEFSTEIAHPFAFYDDISATNSQGIVVATSGTTIGSGGYATALSMLKNKDEFNFNLLFLPGIIDGNANHSGIITQAIDLCESRTDCFLVYDASNKISSVAEVTTNVKTRNSSYAATYYPWVQIQDNSLGTYRYVPPSTVIAGVYHFNDVIGQPWFAPAGLNRGGIDTAIQAYKKLSQSQRDTLYDSNVNPIATFPGQGVTVFGQKTTQKKASALDRVNVRRLLINIKSFVARSSRNLVFEQNTTDLRDQFLNTVNPYLEQVQANAGLQAFEVVMDDTNNTPETIDRNQLVGLIRLQPTRTAEFIVLDFVIEPSGAAFDG